MARRTRRRRRRSHTSKWKKVTIPLGILLAVCLVAGGVAASWAVDVYESAPPLSSLKAVQKGRSSAIYAADGSLIGFIQAENIRQPVPEAAMPQTLRDATIAIEDKNFFNHGALDYTGIARAAMEGPARRRQGGRGRLDDHPAAGPQPLHPEPRTDAQTQADRSPPRRRGGGSPLQGLDPHRLPQHGALRDGRRGDRGRRRGGGADLLRQACQGPGAERIGADRRPAAGALRIQPLPRPARGARAPQRGAGGDARAGLHHRGRIPRNACTAASISVPATSTGSFATPSSSTSSSRN